MTDVDLGVDISGIISNTIEEFEKSLEIIKVMLNDENFTKEQKLYYLLKYFSVVKAIMQISQQTYKELEKILNEQFPEFNSPGTINSEQNLI